MCQPAFLWFQPWDSQPAQEVDRIRSLLLDQEGG